MMRRPNLTHMFCGLAFTLAAYGAVASAPQTESRESAAALAARAEQYGAFGRPYLGGALPNAVALVPAAPKSGDPVQARDDAASRAGLALAETPRWALAMRDASLRKGALEKAFSCSAEIAMSPEKTPALSQLLSRAATDLAFSTSDVKDLYARPRPFMENGQPMCTPEAEAALRTDGSYPSGHSAIGYGLGLILAELVPDRAAALVFRGREFGESRRICNVHWKSDVEEGRHIAAAVVARLHSDPQFIADIAAAKAEIAATQAVPDPADCESESAALALGQ